MTREQAITILKHNISACLRGTEWGEALNMAIKALEQEPTTKIEESNFSQEQYLADIQSAYDCGKSVIDKIRAEIEQTSETIDGFLMHDGTKRTVLRILDKYKTETEVNNG